MDVNDHFVDILKPRNAPFGIIRFMSKSWVPKKTMQLEREYSPQELKDMVANSVYMDSFLEAESVRQGVPKGKLKEEVRQHLDEIGFEKKMHVVRWVGMAFLKIAFQMRIGIFVNEPVVLQLKESMGSRPVLFLPTHRSYADFCLMTYLCFHYDIELPVVAAGMDFLSMAVVGQKMREMCAFYIRRSMINAPVYGATLKHYVRTVVINHGAPFEFFIEGTRSRSNKSISPRFGMLTFSLRAFFARQVMDMLVVPVNISYDRLMELTLFAYEHLGVPKPPESTQGLYRSVQSLNDHFGNVYINFGTPISVKEYFKCDTPSEETVKPLDLHKLTKAEYATAIELANHVVATHQKTTVVTISSLVSLVLMQSLMESKPLHIDEVVPDVAWFSAVLRELGANIYECDLKAEVQRILVIHRRMFALDEEKRLRLVSIQPAVSPTRRYKDKMKGHMLTSSTMANAVPIIELQICLNPVLHYLVPPAIIYLLVVKAVVKNRAECRVAYSKIRKVLCHEFFFEEANEETTYDNAFEYCVKNEVIRCEGGALLAAGGAKFRTLLEWVLLPALTVLSYCLDVLLAEKGGPQKEIQKLVQEMGESRNAHPYCLSLEMSGNCLRGLADAGALHRTRENGAVMYETNLAGCREYDSLIKAIMPDLKPDLGPNNCVKMALAHVASRL